MPGRTYNAAVGYRYGFNGKEQDKDISSLTAYDYGFRIYNPALGRFLSVDPLCKTYPWFTPYQFAGNTPILNIDVDGLENAPTQPNTQGNAVEKPEEIFRKGAVTENQGVTVSNEVKKSWWQRAWSFTKKEIFPRVIGGLKTVGGAAMVFGGGLLSEVGIGVPIAVYGADLAQSGARQVLDGKSHQTFTNQAMTSAGVSQETADHLETVIGIAAGNETNTVLSSPSSATVQSKANSVTTSEETVTVYRGVNETNVGYSNAKNGIVEPNGGIATPAQHNAGNTLNSPFSSWTTDAEVAKNYALRGGNGNGVVLTAQIPKSQLVKSPNTQNVQLVQSGKIVSESEVLVTGKVTGAKVQPVKNP